jgi:hypothetical protein
MEIISQLDAHAKMIELYPEYAFFLPHTSNLDRMLGKDKSIINQAENRLYLNLKKGRKGIKNICPEYGEYFNFVN